MAVVDKRRTSPWWLWWGLALTVTVIWFGSWLAWRSYQTTRELAGNELRLVELQGKVTHLDEVLTTAARMAAATGDVTWEARYHANEPALDAAIKDMLAIAPTQASEMLSAQTDTANQALVAMEDAAFARVRAGDSQGATRILFGDEYQRQKEAYAHGMVATMTAVEESVRAALDEHGRYVIAQTLLTALCLLFAAAAWGRAAYQLRVHSRRLAEALTASRQGHDALRDAHADLEKLHSELIEKEKLSSIGLLAAGVAHEINNPMAYITMNIHTLYEDMRDVRDSLPPVLKDYVEDLLPATIDGIARVNTIVRDLQQFARGDTNELVEFDLNAEIAAAARISANHLKGRIKLDLTLGELPRLHGKPRQLTQVMVNLIVNASHAIGDRPDGLITVKTTHEDGAAVVIINDNGCGMTSDVMTKVFEPFFTTKEAGRGTGLGLSIAFGIVRAHGGTIELDSEPDIGTTFTLRLPVAASPTAPAIPRDLPEGTPPAGTKLTAASGPSSNGTASPLCP